MLNFGASKPRVRGGAGPPGPPPLDPHLSLLDALLKSFLSVMGSIWSVDSLGNSSLSSKFVQYFPSFDVFNFPFQGGMKGVVFTDVFQAFIMLAGLLIVIIQVVYSLFCMAMF